MAGSPYSGPALRRSAWHFLTGKGASALLTVIILLLLVRLLPVNEYGVYLTLTASMELIIAIAGFGLPWIASRYVPEFRLHAPGRNLVRLVVRLVGIYFAVLMLSAGILYLFVGHFLDWLGIREFQYIALLYIWVLLLEGFGRNLREPMLGLLMQQGIGRASLVVRLISLFVLLIFLGLEDKATLTAVVWAEVIASSLGTVVAAVGLLRHLNNLKSMQGTQGWVEPSITTMWKLARDMYIAQLLNLTYGPQLFTVILQHSLGSESVAVFGFMRNIYQQIARNLPAQLMFSIIRPKLVASYVDGGGILSLERKANLVGKLSLFVLMPIVAYVAVTGEVLISQLSGGKFQQTGWLFLGFMFTLISFSQRMILETVAVASGHSKLCTSAALSGLIMLPLMLILLDLGGGLWSPIVGLWAGQTLFNLLILRGLRKNTGYRADIIGSLKLAGVASIAYIIVFLASMVTGIDTISAMLLLIVVTVIVYLIAGWFAKPFSVLERESINSLLKRRLFIW